MSQIKSPVTLSESILEEACGWFIDFNEGELDIPGREQFHQWLRRSPEHVRAYIEIAAAWEDSPRLNPPRTLDIDTLLAQAAADPGNVIPLKPSSTLEQKAPSTAGRMRILALAASVTVAVLGVWIYGHRNLYATAAGEQRSIALIDGSTVVLNSRSRLKVRFTENERTVELLEGQALFQVKKDTARPFVVDSNGTRVRAVGTQFDVYRKATGTTVTVIEGRVAVVPPHQRNASARATSLPATGEEPAQRDAEENSPSPRQRSAAESLSDERPIFLIAGEQLTVTPRLAPRSIRINPALATAWTQRKLIFDETPLIEVVAEFNRYNTRQIVIEDADLAGFHIRGNFQATDPDRLVQFLRDRFGVRASERDGEIHISGN